MMLMTGMLMAGKISVGVRSRMNGVSNDQQQRGHHKRVGPAQG
jgi:hypothetical protein